MAFGWITLRSGDRISYIRSLPFVAVHLACIAAFFLKFHWSYLIVCLALYYTRMFFVTAGYHRYFSHRSFKTSRAFQFVMAFMATMSTQKGVLWWAANHRHHHRYSDTEEDLHSPSLRGFLWSHVGWILSDRYNETRTELIGDFHKYPELRWLNKYHVVPPVILGRLHVPGRRLGHAGVGLLHQHGDLVAQFVHDEFAFAHLWAPPLRNFRFQQEQRYAGAPHHGRGLAQQSPSLHGFRAPGLFLVGSGFHLLSSEDAFVVRNRVGPAPAAAAHLIRRRSGPIRGYGLVRYRFVRLNQPTSVVSSAIASTA